MACVYICFSESSVFSFIPAMKLPSGDKYILINWICSASAYKLKLKTFITAGDIPSGLLRTCHFKSVCCTTTEAPFFLCNFSFSRTRDLQWIRCDRVHLNVSKNHPGSCHCSLFCFFTAHSLRGEIFLTSKNLKLLQISTNVKFQKFNLLIFYS